MNPNILRLESWLLLDSNHNIKNSIFHLIFKWLFLWSNKKCTKQCVWNPLRQKCQFVFSSLVCIFLSLLILSLVWRITSWMLSHVRFTSFYYTLFLCNFLLFEGNQKKRVDQPCSDSWLIKLMRTIKIQNPFIQKLERTFVCVCVLLFHLYLIPWPTPCVLDYLWDSFDIVNRFQP